MTSSSSPIAAAVSGIVASSFMVFATASFADHPTLGLQQDGASAITTLTAITLPDGASVLGFETQYLTNNEIDDADLAHFAEDGELVHSTASLSSLSLNGAYGLTEKLTIGFNLPYVTRSDIREGIHHHDEDPDQAMHDEHAEDDHHPSDEHAASESPEISRLGDSDGVGDLTLYSQYRFIGDSDSRAHASALFGIKTPTGKTDVMSDEGHRFEAEHQPGSGSWDMLAGLTMTRQWSDWTLDSNILYAFAGDGSQDSNLGDVFNYNIALSYRLGEAVKHDHGSVVHHHDEQQSFWDIAFELNGEWRDAVTVAGERQVHTGGNLVYLAPSLRFNSSQGWTAYASVGVPVVRNLNGVQSDPKLRLFVGISTSLGNAK